MPQVEQSGFTKPSGAPTADTLPTGLEQSRRFAASAADRLSEEAPAVAGFRDLLDQVHPLRLVQSVQHGG